MAQAISQFVKHANIDPPSRTSAFLSSHMSNSLNRDVFLCQSDIFRRARCDAVHLHQPRNTRSISAESYTDRQASAKIHCLYGVPVNSISRPREMLTHPYACSVVYDLRNFTQGTKWGPYRDDGRATVDWEKLEAIMGRCFWERMNDFDLLVWDQDCNICSHYSFSYPKSQPQNVLRGYFSSIRYVIDFIQDTWPL